MIDTFNDTLTAVDWKPKLFTTIDPVNEVKEKVLHNAGPIKISQQRYSLTKKPYHISSMKCDAAFVMVSVFNYY